MSVTGVTARRLPAAPLLAVGVLALSCCGLAAWVGNGEARASETSSMLQEGVFTPGIQETIVPQSQGGARQQSLMAGYAAMGTVGGGQHGLYDVPPPPPPTWSRGGHSWVYDGIYGNGQRPTTGIWAQKGFGGPMDAGEPAANDGGVEEQDSVPTEEPAEPAAQEESAGPAAAEPAEDFAEPAAQEPAAEESAAPQEEEVEEPNGQEEIVEEEPAQAEEAPAEEQTGGPPAADDECDDEEDCGGGGAVVVNVPGAPQMQTTVQVREFEFSRRRRRRSSSKKRRSRRNGSSEYDR